MSNVVRRFLGWFLDRPLRLPTGPVPPGWAATLREFVPLARHLSAADQDRLLRIALLFIREVPIEGCQGFAITQQVQVAIAATAALLILKHPYPRFPRLRRVLVYPDTFVPRRVPSWRPQAEPEPTLGEAWSNGMVVLAWEDIARDAQHSTDGHNVILHEFAHVLDFEDGASDGRPLLGSESAIAEWRALLAAEFARLEQNLDRDVELPLRAYAARNPAEFFAVATEAFFEDAANLKARLPELYAILSRFYQQDTAAWTAAA